MFASLSSHSLDRQRWTGAVIDFLRRIGLRVDEATSTAQLAGSFLPDVLVQEGGLVIDAAKAFPGDVLHEAAHLAVIPAQFRPFANGDLNEVEERMARYLNENPMGLATYPEDPLSRAILQAAEAEATAWQYAAAVEIGLPERWIFPMKSYDGTRVSLLRSLRHNQYMGINGLRAAGWTTLRPNPHQPHIPTYPKLKFWLQA